MASELREEAMAESNGDPRTVPDLWPDDCTLVEVVSVEELLRVQAALLEEKTGGALEGHVELRSQGGSSTLEFIAVSRHADHRVHVLTLNYTLLTYPLELTDHLAGEATRTIEEQDALFVALRQVLASPRLWWAFSVVASQGGSPS